VPLAVLPTGPFEGVRFYEPALLPELQRCRQRTVERGQCDIERPGPMWDCVLSRAQDGFVVVDRPDGRPVQGWAYFRHSQVNGKDLLRIAEIGCDDTASLVRLLRFFSSLKDQYASLVLTLPADLPLNRLLREVQVPHRPVNHETAECRPFTRMAVRVLDSRRLIDPMHLPPEYRGTACVAVHESGGEEGDHVSRFRIELNDGRARVTSREAPAGAVGWADPFECRGVTWSAIVCGDLPATAAVRLGLAQDGGGAAALLDAFASGPLPYAIEDF
jgi:predicted acetyltransferase